LPAESYIANWHTNTHTHARTHARKHANAHTHVYVQAYAYVHSHISACIASGIRTRTRTHHHPLRTHRQAHSAPGTCSGRPAALAPAHVATRCDGPRCSAPRRHGRRRHAPRRRADGGGRMLRGVKGHYHVHGAAESGDDVARRRRHTHELLSQHSCAPPARSAPPAAPRCPHPHPPPASTCCRSAVR